jgi:hypothetical protein
MESLEVLFDALSFAIRSGWTDLLRPQHAVTRRPEFQRGRRRENVCVSAR